LGAEKSGNKFKTRGENTNEDARSYQEHDGTLVKRYWEPTAVVLDPGAYYSGLKP